MLEVHQGIQVIHLEFFKVTWTNAELIITNYFVVAFYGVFNI
jgi:hypothetical protein